MAFAIEAAQDAYLDRVCDTVENLYITDNTAEPSTYTEAQSTKKLGTKATPTIGAAAADGGGGRKRTVSAITDGTVDTTGTAAWWALTDNSLSELLATGALSDQTQVVTSGNTFTTDAFDIVINDAT